MRSIRIAAIAIAAATIGAGVTAYVTDATSSTTFFGCEKAGYLRGRISVDAAQECLEGETAVSWSDSGSGAPSATVAVLRIRDIFNGGEGSCGPDYQFVSSGCGAFDQLAPALGLTIDPADYPTDAAYTIEVAVVNGSPDPVEVCMRLWDFGSGQPVPGSETCRTIAGAMNGQHGDVFRGDPFTIVGPGARDFNVQIREPAIPSPDNGVLDIAAIEIRVDW